MSGRYQIRGHTAKAIGASVEEAVRQGRLAAGDRLPTVRALAETLGVSPATVAAAYRDLRARALVITDGRRGTRVSGRPPVVGPLARAARPGVRNLADGNPDPDLLPDLGPVLADLRIPTRLYGDRAHHPGLLERARRALAADGIAGHHLAVVGGALDGVERVLQAHLVAGDRVAVEDPGYSGVLDLVAALGLSAEPFAVDDDGPLPDGLEGALGRGARACVVTPRAQNPTGAAMGEARAAELRRILRRHPDLLVVEDDHAGVVAGTAHHTLCRNLRSPWAVVRSVSKSLGPDLRLAVVAGDAVTVARVEGRQAIGTGWVSHLLQGAVAALWADRSVTKLLAEAARTYSRRRQATVDALAEYGVKARGRSGLNVWVPVPEESAVIGGMLEAGWGLQAGERYRVSSPPAVRISTSRLHDGEAPAVAAALARCLRPTSRTRSV